MRTHPLVVVTLGLGLAVTGALGAGCQKASKEKPAAGSAGSGQGSAVATAGSGSATGSGSAAAAPVDPPKDIDSKDILARTETAPQVYVKHVLLGWKELASARPGQSDPRAAKRTNAEAAALAQEIAGKLKANPDSIDALIKESSEDPGSLTG